MMTSPNFAAARRGRFLGSSWDIFGAPGAGAAEIDPSRVRATYYYHYYCYYYYYHYYYYYYCCYYYYYYYSTTTTTIIITTTTTTNTNKHNDKMAPERRHIAYE